MTDGQTAGCGIASARDFFSKLTWQNAHIVQGVCGMWRIRANGGPKGQGMATFLSPMAATGLSTPILVHRGCPATGVVEHGLFIGLASTAILAGAQGIRVVERQ